MTLWDKGQATDKDVEAYTVGNDHALDLELLPYDCKASIAHAKTLAKAGLVTEEEAKQLEEELQNIIDLAKKGSFPITQAQEDGHTAIEEHLTKQLGAVGKKIHTGRSRNDQVLAAMRLYEMDKLAKIQESQQTFIKALQEKIAKQGAVQLPGYTHTQKAMPNNVKKWLGAFISAAKDNDQLIEAVKQLIDQSPLGSAAGFGTTLGLDDDYTAEQAGFSKAMQPVTYAQHSRGKFESTVIHCLTQIMYDLQKLASDLILYNTSQFGYVKLPKKFCTGSSIMPQKSNPDALELVRANHHVILGEEFKVKSMTSNLISGYHRDLQLTKEPVMKTLEITLKSLKLMAAIVQGMAIDASACKQAMTPELHATEEAYKLIKQGMPFREAYEQVGKKYS